MSDDELKWARLLELQGRLEADLLRSFLEASGIQVELFQEAVGHHIYPVTVDGLGQWNCSCREQVEEARRLVAEFRKPSA
jgi:hypothetical protein